MRDKEAGRRDIHVLVDINGSEVVFENRHLSRIAHADGSSLNIECEKGTRNGAPPTVSSIKLPDGKQIKKQNDQFILEDFATGRVENVDVTICDDRLQGAAVMYSSKSGAKHLYSSNGIDRDQDSMLTVPKLSQLFEKAVSKFDTDKDGRLSTNELKNAVATGEDSGLEAQFLAFSIDNFEDLASLFRKEDISRFDYDGNGKIGNEDLNKSVLDGRLSEEVASQLKGTSQKLLREEMKWRSKLFDSQAISSEDISEFSKFWQAGIDEKPDKLDAHKNVLAGMIRTDNRMILCSDFLYAKTTPFDSIKPYFVNQHGVGDCYWEASVAAIAAVKPQLIERMLQDNEDGSYTVSFDGKAPKQIIVPRLNTAEKLLYAGVSSGGIWPGVLQKAWGMYRNSELGVARRDAVTFQDVTESGDGNEALTALINNKVTHLEFCDPQVTTSVLEESLNKVVDKKVAMVVSTESSSKTGMDGVVGRHVYAVVGYNKGERKIRLMDTNGVIEPESKFGRPLDGRRDGQFEISVEQLQKYFRDLDVVPVSAFDGNVAERY